MPIRTRTLATLGLDEARDIFTGAPFLQRLFSPGMSVLDLANKVGCFRTEKDAVRIIRAGGFYINMVGGQHRGDPHPREAHHGKWTDSYQSGKEELLYC